MTTDELYKLIIDGISLPTTRDNDTTTINASAIYDTCPRGFLLSNQKNVLLYSSKNKYSDDELVTYKIGLKLEEMIAEALSKYAIPLKELFIKLPEFNIKGHSDIIIKVNDRKYILEIKSIDKDLYDRLGNQPPYRNEFQLQVYLYLAKKHKMNIESGFLVYVAKGRRKPPLKIYKVNLDNTCKKKIKEFITKINQKDMSRVCATINHAKSTKCSIVGLCWEEENGIGTQSK